ncbi:MAG: sigma 54-interacting transcriptional regulator [Candidatus Krumholzibacteriia bacterium]
MPEPSHGPRPAADALGRAQSSLERIRGRVSAQADTAKPDGAQAPEQQNGSGPPAARSAARRGQYPHLPDLLSLSRKATSILELRPLLDQLLSMFMSMTDAERGFIMLDWRSRKFEAARNVDPDALEGDRLAITSGVVDDVGGSGKSLFVSDTLAEGNYGCRESVIQLRLRSFTCVPMMHAGRVLGICYTDSTKPGNLLEEVDTSTLQEFANQAAVAIENARRHEELIRTKSRLEDENENLRRQMQRSNRFANILGESPVMQRLFDLLEKMSGSSSNVLIQGETGTGKELIARALHFNGPQRDGPWVPVNCGAVPEPLLESELFGHKRGAFTGAVGDHRGLFEVADGGTLFLDEIGEMPLPLQVKLLRVLQEGEVKPVGDTRVRRFQVRVIAATNRDLARGVEQGTFRRDLYYRLAVIPVHLPALRERGNDIILLAEAFVARFARKHGKSVSGLEPEAVRWLLQQRWEGNIRELENMIDRGVTLCEDGKRLGLTFLSGLDTEPVPDMAAVGTLREMVGAYERVLVQRALQECDNRVSRAAQKLGVSRQHLHNLIRKHTLREPRQKS